MKLSLISITNHVTSRHSSSEGQGVTEVGSLEIPTCCLLAGASQLSSCAGKSLGACEAPCATASAHSLQPALGTA